MSMIQDPTIWFYHGPPREDEVFASWLARLAFYQGNDNVAAFFNMVFSDTPRLARSRLLHGRVSRGWMKQLSRATGLTMVEVRRAVSRANWFTLLDSDYRTKYSITLNRHCPLCLDEDNKDSETTYLRKIWSFPFLVICCEHQVLLNDTCYKCGYRNGVKQGRIWRYTYTNGSPNGPLSLTCPDCNSDLSCAPVIHVDSGDPALELSRILNDLLKHPSSRAQLGGSNISSREFLRTISVITRFVSGSLRKDQRFTKELYPVIQQVAGYWKIWPKGFDEWLTAKPEGNIFTRGALFRTFLKISLDNRGRYVPGPLRIYLKSKFKRRVDVWTFEKAIEYMIDWVKKNPGKYPSNGTSELQGLRMAIGKKKIETPEGKTIKFWLEFLEILRQRGVEIPKFRYKNWSYETIYKHVSNWMEANPGQCPISLLKGLKGVYATINMDGMRHPSGKILRNLQELIIYLRKDGLDIPIPTTI